MIILCTGQWAKPAHCIVSVQAGETGTDVHDICVVRVLCGVTFVWSGAEKQYCNLFE